MKFYPYDSKRLKQSFHGFLGIFPGKIVKMSLSEKKVDFLTIGKEVNFLCWSIGIVLKSSLY